MVGRTTVRGEAFNVGDRSGRPAAAASTRTVGPSSMPLDAPACSQNGSVMAMTGAALRPAVRAIPAGWYQWLFLAATALLVGRADPDNWAPAPNRSAGP